MIRKLKSLAILMAGLFYVQSYPSQSIPNETTDIIRKYSKNELLGKIIPTPPLFSEVPLIYASRLGIFLQTEVLIAFEGLQKAAADEGIELIVISGIRTFSHQRSIWESKWARPKYMGWDELEKARDILTYSSMPGTSRHHWGTDLDLNALENAYFKSGEGREVYEFLDRCAADFGFYQVYSEKNEGSHTKTRTGYEEEKWHWSYLPIAHKMLQEYNSLISTEDIHGFQGASAADSLKIINNYVNGILTSN
jgi:zinc D-Ala-D-Ala carboxypeptidase